jgi:hypothetical protein
VIRLIGFADAFKPETLVPGKRVPDGRLHERGHGP